MKSIEDSEEEKKKENSKYALNSTKFLMVVLLKNENF